MKPLVYIASPYRIGDPAINTRVQLKAFDDLLSSGLVWPVAPLWTHFQHIYRPRPASDWINYDLALLERCDALFRLNAHYPPLDYHIDESQGADGEVDWARKKGLPVFYLKKELYDWARRGSPFHPVG